MPDDFSIQSYREKFIRQIVDSEDETSFVREKANDLFSLGLTIYSRNFSFKSLVYNSFSTSHLDEEISLHPEQLKVLQLIENQNGVIFSAPTSFGKTFVIFEHIAREKPNNVVLVVPTLALVDEYNKRIINKYKSSFEEYNVYLSVSDEEEYDFTKKNIFILTHDRIVEQSNYLAIKKIDFLVIDEVYKLQRDDVDDRVLILNLAYYHLVKIAEKHILLAPFISGVKNLEKLEKKPVFHSTSYSPVINEVKVYDIINDRDRFSKTEEIISLLPENEKMMIYFPTVANISKFVKENLIRQEKVFSHQFIEWLKTEIHKDWYLVKAMEQGYLVHNGQLPVGVRMYQLYLYETEENFNKLICNSALLEGINTSAKHIIIGKPSRSGRDQFDAFDFFNLVGRSGRLYEHHLGCAHYVKSPLDQDYKKDDAIKSIEFELTDNSEDIDIHRDKYEENHAYLTLLNQLGISHEEYKTKVGSKLRLRTILELFQNYQNNKADLFNEIQQMIQNSTKGRYHLINSLLTIINGGANNLTASIINLCIHKGRLSLNEIISQLAEHYSVNIDFLINRTIQIKSSYIEHAFYSRLNLILFFMECEPIKQEFIELLDLKVKAPISYLYYTDSRQRKMLKDLGIYERDIEKIIQIIGEDFREAFELKKLFQAHKNKFSEVSFISRFIIKSLVN